MSYPKQRRKLEGRDDFLKRVIPFTEELLREMRVREISNFGGLSFRIESEESGTRSKDVKIFYHRAIKPELVVHFRYSTDIGDGEVIFFEKNQAWQFTLRRVMRKKIDIIKKISADKSRKEQSAGHRSRALDIAAKSKNLANNKDITA
ncbi:hypothetical protein KW796_00210 [Candidatus Parcubacteria bacterium]|nr:hypothetical protein [Candidatus Parcubacteria bacterium]